jgi:WD40 repeat protein
MDKLVGVFDVQTGKRVLTLAGHTEWEADATALSPDGKLLASTGTDKQILVWELATGKLRHQLKDQPYRTAALAFSPERDACWPAATKVCSGTRSANSVGRSAPH